MAFNLRNFNQNLTDYGVSSPSKFEVNITLPNCLTQMLSSPNCGFISQFQTIMPYRAYNCSPPGLELQTNQTHNLGIGPKIKMPYNAAFSECRMGLLADSESIIENTFNLWLNLLFNFSYSDTQFATYYTGYRDDIVSPSIVITKFDYNGQKILDYHLYSAFPTQFIGAVMDWGATNALNRFQVQFHFMSYSITNYS